MRPQRQQRYIHFSLSATFFEDFTPPILKKRNLHINLRRSKKQENPRNFLRGLPIFPNFILPNLSVPILPQSSVPQQNTSAI